MNEDKAPASTETISSEEKIKSAARKLFTQKGFAAVKTRDIAEAAGINLALLNYYFRSKEKLFDIVMTENLHQFAHGITSVLNDDSQTVSQRIEKLVEVYIDTLSKYPDLPLFVMSEMRRDPENFAAAFSDEIGLTRTKFFNKMQDEFKHTAMKDLHVAHFVANLIGLTIFPFTAAPMLKKVTGIDDDQFMKLMEERKKLIPHWLGLMLKENKDDAKI